MTLSKWLLRLVLSHQLAVVFLLAFGLRAAPIVFMEVREPGWHERDLDPKTDPMEFYCDDVARSLIDGKGFVHCVNLRPGCPCQVEPGTPFQFIPPLCAWWLALVYFAFGPSMFIARILQCAMDACVCPLLYVLARRLTGDRTTALLSALLYSVYPLCFYVCLHLYYQLPLNLALIWVVLSLMAPVSWRNGLWAGLAVAVSALAKPVTLPLLVLIPAVRLAECLRRKMSLRACVLWCFCFTAASLAALTPWTVRNYVVFHRFVPVQTGGGVPLFQGSKEKYIDISSDAFFNRYGSELGRSDGELTRLALQNHIEHLCDAPFDYLRFLGKKFLMAWYNTEAKAKNGPALLIQIPFLAMAILGLVCIPRLWRTNGNWYLPAMIFYICLVQVAFYPLVRYTFAAMPLVMVVGAVAVAWIVRHLRTTKEPNHAAR